MVLSLWAITMRVAFRFSRLALTMACVRLSRALVASSKSSMRGLDAIARAIINLWRWPPEIVEAPSPRKVNIPMGIISMSSVEPGHARRFPGLVHRELGDARDVLVDGARHQPAVLEHHPHLAAHRLDVELGEVVVVEVDGAGLGLLEAQQLPEQRRLAGARRADDRDELAGLGPQGNVVEHERAVWVVAERDVVDLYPAPQFARVGLLVSVSGRVRRIGFALS